MRKAVPIIIVVVIVALTLGLIYFATRPRERPMELPQPAVGQAPVAPAAKPEPMKNPQGVSVQGAEIEQRDPAGKVQWKVTAGGDLEFDKNAQMATGHDVVFEMVQQDQTPIVVKASEFQANYNSRKLTFTKGVSGRMTDGSAHFTVNHLVYDFDTKKLTGTGGAKFVQGNYKAVANNIVVDWKIKKVRMRGGVRFTKSG
ncbi:MAG: hypothetical protein ABFE08_12115 [Armatimonadia bacterium]